MTLKVSGSKINRNDLIFVERNTICFKVIDAAGNESDIIGITYYVIESILPAKQYLGMED